MVLHPKVNLKYLGVYNLLYNKVGCNCVKKKGVWCVESVIKERIKIKKYIITLKYNKYKKDKSD